MSPKPDRTPLSSPRRAAFAAALLLTLPWAARAIEPDAPAAPAPQAKPADLPHGKLVENVPCQGHPDQTYALYLPSNYQAGRKWPILYAFDARRDGKLVSDRLQEGAERYGWIVASSYNSASDGPSGPNLAALQAMWADTHARFSVDDRRVYLAGFSGTVRFAVNVALSAPGTVTGILGACAGFPEGVKPQKNNPFVFFGTTGERDFNYYEMMDLDATLASLGVPHRIEVFEGSHEWPPAPLATRAIGWMELQAMKAGLREKSPQLVDPLWDADLAQARALETAGDLLGAHHVYAAMAQDYAGLRSADDLAPVAGRISAIEANAAYTKALRTWQERNRKDQDFLVRAPHAFSQPVLSDAIDELKIYQYKRQAESSDKQESLAAKRVLNTILVQTSFYLPQMFTDRGEHDRAIFALSIAAEIRPESPEIWYQLAAANARKGNKKKALELLRKAVDKGFNDKARLAEEKAFDNLRQEKAYQEVAAKLG
jgi:tetratricopeptide (TPR) repeat protein